MTFYQTTDINSFTQDRVSVTFYQIIDINSFTQDRVSVIFYQTNGINSFAQDRVSVTFYQTIDINSFAQDRLVRMIFYQTIETFPLFFTDTFLYLHVEWLYISIYSSDKFQQMLFLIFFPFCIMVYK